MTRATARYAFAMPPSWKGQSNALDSGGQILAFVDDNNQGKTDALVTIVAQPTKLATIDELEKAIVPKGELISKKISVKDASQKDGSVIIVRTVLFPSQTSSGHDTVFSLLSTDAAQPHRKSQFEANDKTKDLRVMALFSLRVQPTGNWLVSMTCQARGELYPSYINEVICNYLVIFSFCFQCLFRLDADGVEFAWHKARSCF